MALLDRLIPFFISLIYLIILSRAIYSLSKQIVWILCAVDYNYLNRISEYFRFALVVFVCDAFGKIFIQLADGKKKQLGYFKQRWTYQLQMFLNYKYVFLPFPTTKTINTYKQNSGSSLNVFPMQKHALHRYYIQKLQINEKTIQFLYKDISWLSLCCYSVR